jgi:hypothetical protein
MDNGHWRLSGVAQSPYIKRRVSEAATYSTLDCGYGSSWPRGTLIGSMRVRWSRPLQREAASVAAPAQCAPKPVRSLSCHFATSAHVRFTAHFRGQKRTSDGRRPRPRAHGQTRLGRTTLVVARRGCLPRRRPDTARCGPVCGPAPTPYSHTPPHAGARRNAASPMTLVDAHRAARRDSPVLPVRIFPVGLSQPNPGREA